jgi:hypothetical protein
MVFIIFTDFAFKMYIQHIMNTTHILTDIESGFGKIYLILNRTHGYYTILPLVETNFLSFLEELYSYI